VPACEQAIETGFGAVPDSDSESFNS
jgi:hypothetical protein